jgi:hypothetical protein
MPSKHSVSLNLPWCEADQDAYTDAMNDAIDASDASMDDITKSGRVALTVNVFPAHYTACTLMDAYDAATYAIRSIYNYRVEVVSLTGRMARPTDNPRIQITIAKR